MMGKMMSGNVATCLMSTTWETARFTWTLALADIAVPIILKIINSLKKLIEKPQNISFMFKSKRLGTYRLYIDVEIVFFRVRW